MNATEIIETIQRGERARTPLSVRDPDPQPKCTHSFQRIACNGQDDAFECMTCGYQMIRICFGFDDPNETPSDGD